MAARPRPSAGPLATPASPASPELKAMVFCVVDQCLTARKPLAHAPPQIDRRARKRPAKSVSAYARRGAPSPCRGKW
eukprot:8141757-Alexandrium_andersonii.AAC.1